MSALRVPMAPRPMMPTVRSVAANSGSKYSQRRSAWAMPMRRPSFSRVSTDQAQNSPMRCVAPGTAWRTMGTCSGTSGQARMPSTPAPEEKISRSLVMRGKTPAGGSHSSA